MEAERMQAAKRKLTPALVFHTDLLAVRARGARVEDASGRHYLDFTSGLATTATGHCHPRVVAAIREQAQALLHAGGIFYHEPLLALCEELARVTPEGLDRFFFSNSGAEAVEGALKLARFHTGRPSILAFTPSFHGRTLGALSLTSSTSRYRRGYGPLLPSVHHVPYPYCYRCAYSQRPETCASECLGRLDWLFAHLVPPEEVACAVIEPVLGEGGYVVPPHPFLGRLRELCDRHGILLVHDEVQCGMGRTGRWLAAEHFGVVPDILVLAKGIASGLPLSAVVSRADVMDGWPPGAHGTTFGGNPVSCAAAVATLGVIREEGLLDNAARVGTQALERLGRLKATCPRVGDVRGLGLMIGVEFVREGRRPDSEAARRVVAHCLERGLLLVECGRERNVIRLAPPLVVTGEEMDEGLDLLEGAVRALPA